MYIRKKIPAQDKVKYIMQFGQNLMKNKPDETLDFIKHLVRLEIIQKRLSNQKQSIQQ